MLQKISTILCTAVTAVGLLIDPASAATSQSVSVGSRLVHGSTLQPYTNAWQMATVSKTGERRADAGTWTDRLERVTIGGKSYFKRTQIASFKRKNGAVGATTETVNIFDARTLAPMSRTFKQRVVTTGQTSTRAVRFDPGLTIVTTTASGKTHVTTTRSSRHAFDFYGGVYALIWIALPLRQGFTATFPSYGEEDPATVTPVSYTVSGSETITVGSHHVNTWRINCNSEIGPLTYWVTAKPPYIIRMEYTDASTGTTWTLTQTTLPAAAPVVT
jgi:hypothetical protein